jgi:hypothetical protein
VRSPRVLGILVVAAAAIAPAPVPPDRGEDEEKVERPIPFPDPAGEMRKLSFLLGTWEGTETWSEPKRYKRGKYEGYPGPGGHRTRRVEPGPGEFSFVLSEDGRNPMGQVQARGFLSWDPARRRYVYDQVMSVFPGILRLSGGFEKDALVLFGEDHVTGRKRAVRLSWTALTTEGFTETLEAAETGRRFEKVVITQFRKSPKP